MVERGHVKEHIRTGLERAVIVTTISWEMPFGMVSLRSVCGNEKGIVLPVALMFLVILSVMGSAAV